MFTAAADNAVLLHRARGALSWDGRTACQPSRAPSDLWARAAKTLPPTQIDRPTAPAATTTTTRSR